MLVFSTIIRSAFNTQNIDRIEYGIQFKYFNEFHIVSDYYQVILQIKIPDAILQHSTPNQSPPIHVGQEIEKDKKKIYILTPDYVANDIIHSYNQQLANFISDFNYLLPDEPLSAKSLHKRGLINLVGKLSKYLFGTTTEENYDQLLSYIKNNLRVDKNGSSIYLQQQNDFIKINKLTNERVDKLYSIIKHQQQVMDTAYSNVEGQINNVQLIQLFLHRFTSHYHHINHIISYHHIIII